MLRDKVQLYGPNEVLFTNVNLNPSYLLEDTRYSSLSPCLTEPLQVQGDVLYRS